MTIRISVSIRIMLLAALAGFSTVSLAAEKTVSGSPAGGDIPSLERIRADASHYFVHDRDGLPSIRDLESSRSVDDAVINSSVREGDLLTLNVSFLLTELNANGKKNTLVRSRMTYRETDGVWELQSVLQNSIHDRGSSSPISEDDC